MMMGTDVDTVLPYWKIRTMETRP